MTHYLLHICIAFQVLRHFWPQEDWPLGAGLAALLGYLVVFVPATHAWLRRFPRGPMETLLSLAAGGAGPAVRPL